MAIKVFQVICEYTGDDGEVIEESQFVTHESNSLLGVTKHFTKHCDEFEKDLKSVRDVLNIVEHINVNQ
jgi:ribosomal protein S15P/S13E